MIIIILFLPLAIIFAHNGVSVEAQTMGSCRSTADCSGGFEVGEMTIEQCCLGTTNGLAFSAIGTDLCTTCIGV